MRVAVPTSVPTPEASPCACVSRMVTVCELEWSLFVSLKAQRVQHPEAGACGCNEQRS